MSGAAEVLIEKKEILQGPNSVPLSETVVEDLCHGRALSISLAVTHTVSLSQGSRMEKFKKQGDLQPEVLGSSLQGPGASR